MRQIKFRGRETAKPNRWMYGYVYEDKGTMFIWQKTENNMWPIECDTESIGQFTGMQDKNGKDVYEGDILRVPETMLNAEIYGVVEYEDNGFIVRSVRSGCKTDLAWVLRKRMEGEPMTEVVGNVTDNPELIGKQY